VTDTTETNDAAQAGADATQSETPQAETVLTPAQKAAATRAAKAAAKASETTDPEPTTQETVVATPAKVKRVKIILEENDAIPPTGQFFGVNGTGYQIQPGKEVEIPEFLLGVIDNAVTTKPILNDDGQVVGYRDVPRFPYRIVK
jgi:hypothetical protein